MLVGGGCLGDLGELKAGKGTDMSKIQCIHVLYTLAKKALQHFCGSNLSICFKFCSEVEAHGLQQSGRYCHSSGDGVL